MPKKPSIELSEVSIRRLRHGTNPQGEPVPLKHRVGGVKGLYLQCNPPKGSEKIGSRQWLYRTTIGNERPFLGVGGYPSVHTKTAKEEARRLKQLVKDGIDPRIEKKEKKAQLQQEQRQQLTFKQAAAKYLIKKQAEYKTAKQVKKVSSQFRDYVYPYIGDMQVKDIERPHLISMLENYYLTVPSTAIRVINHVEKVIQQAIIEGKRKTANPAVWHKNLSLVFPSKEKIAPTQHHPSLPWKELPEFMLALDDYRKPKGQKADGDCTAFIIHSVARVSEARLMKWSDVDLENKVWTIKEAPPKGEDMRKSKRKWYIHLTPPAIKILKEQPSYKTKRGLVFRNADGEAIDGSYFGSNITGFLGFEGDTHGFRSTFHTWTQEHGINPEVASLAMKHTNTDATRAAYARSQLFDDRKKLLTAWSKYVTTGEDIASANVIPIKKRAS
ncbi:MAG TPA: site-specific integrase [Gammaproteobacteria bacterium]|nr:site-specific integrase [Gammaproteobacteria bacterium]HIL63523.1 site-specific integrase [Porticoccaceae bacterium]